jgi:hypothetical protein
MTTTRQHNNNIIGAVDTTYMLPGGRRDPYFFMPVFNDHLDTATRRRMWLELRKHPGLVGPPRTIRIPRLRLDYGVSVLGGWKSIITTMMFIQHGYFLIAHACLLD